MKRHLFLFAALLSPLASCAENLEKIPVFQIEKNTVMISSGTDYLFEYINSEKLQQRIDEGDSFPLFVTSPGCGTCDLFSISVKDYLRRTNIVLPHIQLNQYLMVSSLPKISSTSFVFIKRGKAIRVEENIDKRGYTDAQLDRFFEKRIDIRSVYRYDDLVLHLPLQGDFNTFDFQGGISRGGEGLISTFDADVFIEKEKSILMSDRKLSNTEIFDIYSDHPFDGYCEITKNSDREAFSSIAYIAEEFHLAIACYSDKFEGGYKLEII